MTYSEMWRRLARVYGEGEAKAIARMVYEVRLGLTFPDICIGKDTQLSADRQAELEEIARRLERQEPVQYVLGVADFCGRQLVVSPAVLIPRPETEELCRWVIEAVDGERREGSGCSILDVGTGSGCIAVTLAAALPQASVAGWDISATALQVARENARRQGVGVTFEQVDILQLPSPITQHPTPITHIVSNPPYIYNKERAKMEPNVLDYEPHEALFVPDDDPLLFYRAIARYGQTALAPGGWLYFEINPLCADALVELLSAMAFAAIEVRADQYGKQRMIRARR